MGSSYFSAAFDDSSKLVAAATANPHPVSELEMEVRPCVARAALRLGTFPPPLALCRAKHHAPLAYARNTSKSRPHRATARIVPAVHPFIFSASEMPTWRFWPPRARCSPPSAAQPPPRPLTCCHCTLSQDRAILPPGTQPSSVEQVCYLSTLAVAPTHQRCGLGARWNCAFSSRPIFFYTQDQARHASNASAPVYPPCPAASAPPPSTRLPASHGHPRRG